uniref:Plasmid transfer protein n=1 Tax=Ascaris lumbricoides TaxID=6252 RepID=A0A0M3IX61_ASCLU
MKVAEADRGAIAHLRMIENACSKDIKTPPDSYIEINLELREQIEVWVSIFFTKHWK